MSMTMFIVTFTKYLDIFFIAQDVADKKKLRCYYVYYLSIQSIPINLYMHTICVAWFIFNRLNRYKYIMLLHII